MAFPSDKQKFTFLLAFGSYVVVQCLASLLRNLKSNWMASFLLPDSCSIDYEAARSNVFHPDTYNVTTSKLAVQGEIE